MHRTFFIIIVGLLAAVLGGCGVPHRDLPSDRPDWAVVRRETPTASAAFPIPDLSEQVRLDRLITLAFERNPALRAARERYRATVASRGAAVGLPDPMVQWTHRPDPIETRTGPQTDVLQASQRIPFPGKLVLKGEIAEDEARIARMQFVIASRDLVAELKESYAELQWCDRAIDIVRRSKALADALAKRSQGALTFNAMRAEADAAQLTFDLTTLLERRSAEEATINRILSLPPTTPIGAPEPLAFRPLTLDRKALLELCVDHRQELDVALLRIRKAGRMRELADLSWAPDFFVGGALMITGSPLGPTPDAGQDPWGVTFGLTLPVWGSKNRSRTLQAEHLRQAAIRDRQDAWSRALEMATKQWFALQNAQRLVVLYRDTLLPQARSAIENAESMERSGADPLTTGLDAQAALLNFSLAYARAAADHEKGLARLERTVGMPLSDFVERPVEEGR